MTYSIYHYFPPRAICLSLTLVATKLERNVCSRWTILLSSNGDLGPVVQSVVSLTSSLRVISLIVLADSIYNILIFFADKMLVAFALTFFQQTISAYLRITRCKF